MRMHSSRRAPAATAEGQAAVARLLHVRHKKFASELFARRARWLARVDDGKRKKEDGWLLLLMLMLAVLILM